MNTFIERGVADAAAGKATFAAIFALTYDKKRRDLERWVWQEVLFQLWHPPEWRMVLNSTSPKALLGDFWQGTDLDFSGL